MRKIGFWKVGLHWGRAYQLAVQSQIVARKYTYSELVGTELVIFMNTHIYAYRYKNAITVNGSRGHEFKGKQEGYMC